MQKYIAERFRNAFAGLSLDTEALRRYSDVIDLSIGDTDFTTDRRIIDAAYADACAGYTHYGDPKGDPELIEAICQAWKEDFNQDVSPAEVLVTTSSCMGMSQALLALLNPGDEVLVFGPYFADYNNQIYLAGGKMDEGVTKEENHYAPEEAAIRAAITPRTRAMIVNTPCNPTGAAYSTETLTMLAKLATEYDLLILADEIYTRYLYDGAFVPMRTLPGMADRVVTLNSFSKNFLMTGWRVGVIIAEPALLCVMNQVNGALIYSAPSISQRAAIAALENRARIRERYIAAYRERIFYSTERLEKLPYLSLVAPKGTFYLFPGVEKTGLSSGEFCKALLERAHILVSPGDVFGIAGKQHFRIACTVNIDKLREAYDRMEALSF